MFSPGADSALSLSGPIFQNLTLSLDSPVCVFARPAYLLRPKSRAWTDNPIGFMPFRVIHQSVTVSCRWSYIPYAGSGRTVVACHIAKHLARNLFYLGLLMETVVRFPLASSLSQADVRL